MPTVGPDAFNHALHTANTWLADLGDAFGTRDRRYCNRVLRTWLHTLRDRLTVDAAAKFGQQLPELLRGVYYDGWEPNRVPIKYHTDGYVQRFAGQASIPLADVPATAATITGVIARRMSPGQLAQTLAELPAELRTLVAEGTTGGRLRTAAEPVTAPERDRVTALEDQVGGLTEAVRALAHGLEDGQFTAAGPDQVHIARAARLADEILMTAGARPTA